jgi:hypothetical protein
MTWPACPVCGSVDEVGPPKGRNPALPALALVLFIAAASWSGCSSPDLTTTTAGTSADRPGSPATTTADTSSAEPSTVGPVVGSPGAVRYQEDNAYLARTGIWTPSVTPEDADGNFVFASQKSSITVCFRGTSVAYIAKKAYVYGVASLTLDDRAPVEVDLDYPVAQYQQRVWESGTLPAGTHTLRVEWTGDPGTDSRGAFINLDAFEIVGDLLFAEPPARVEQDDKRFFYTGTWDSATDPSASAGTLLVADSPGASVTFAFNGPHFAWIAKTGPEYGKAKVTMYGRLGGVEPDPIVVDLYSSSEAWKQVVLEAPFDSPGPTSVTIDWTGTKSAAATGTSINIDAADIIGRMVQAPARYEETRGPKYAFADSFSWNVYSPARLASGLKYCHTEFVGATATIRFNGRYLAWVAKRAPTYGIARVTLDGGEPVEVDLYDVNWLWKQHVWNTGLLSPGIHTVTIECTGRKSPKATKAFINIDGFDVVGELLGY